MRMIIEARNADDVGSKVIRLAEFERLDGDLKLLGENLTKAEILFPRLSVHWSAHRLVLLFLPRLIARNATGHYRSKRHMRFDTERFVEVTIDSLQLRSASAFKVIVQNRSAYSHSMPLRVSLER